MGVGEYGCPVGEKGAIGPLKAWFDGFSGIADDGLVSDGFFYRRLGRKWVRAWIRY